MDTQVIYTGSDGQALVDIITIDGKPLDLTGKTVKFKMRHASSDVLKVNASASVTDADDGAVSYTWTDANLDTPGEYYCWWEIKSGSATLDTPETLIVITKHSPGIRTTTGAFYEFAKSYLPVTWRHLEQEQGDDTLQNRVEIIKLKVFNQEIAVEDEADYDIRVQDYIGKLVAISVIPSAIDYWMNQHQTLSATGTNENVSYPDRIEALEKLREKLIAEVAEAQDIIEDIIGVPTIVPLTGTPGLSLGKDEGFATPLPQEHFHPYAFPKSNTLW
jgi:hypothetical protein